MAVAPRHRPRLVRRSRIPTLRWWPRLRGHHGAPWGTWTWSSQSADISFQRSSAFWNAETARHHRLPLFLFPFSKFLRRDLFMVSLVIFANLWLALVMLPWAPENRCTVRFPILRAMEVLVEAASEVPQGCFVTGIRKGHGLHGHVTSTSQLQLWEQSSESQSLIILNILIIHIDSYIIYKLFIVVLDRFDSVCFWMSYWNDWASLRDSGTINKAFGWPHAPIQSFRCLECACIKPSTFSSCPNLPAFHWLEVSVRLGDSLKQRRFDTWRRWCVNSCDPYLNNSQYILFLYYLIICVIWAGSVWTWGHKETLMLWSIFHCEDKNSAKYYFPTPEEKRKARIDVTRLQILQIVAWMWLECSANMQLPVHHRTSSDSTVPVSCNV